MAEVSESAVRGALDGVIDDLSRYLGSIPDQDVEHLMPHDVAALTRVFPVLLQVRAIARPHHEQEPESADLLGLRRRAFAALRELLRRLANRRSLVMCIDDLQWADADSSLLLEELLRPPRSPALLPWPALHSSRGTTILECNGFGPAAAASRPSLPRRRRARSFSASKTVKSSSFARSSLR